MKNQSNFTTLRLVHDIRPPCGVMQGVCFSPDSQFFAGVSLEGRLSVYRADNAEPQFVFLPFSEKKWLTLSATGQILDGELQKIQDELIILAELSSGQTVSYTVREFRESNPSLLNADHQKSAAGR